MREARMADWIGCLVLTIFFGIGIWSWADDWNLKTSLGYSAYACLAFLVVKTHAEVRELRNQLSKIKKMEGTH